MNPYDLKSPFKWEERKVLLEDHVLYVPDRLDNYANYSFQFFENNNPIHIEYCSGNGAWIAEKAKANPDINYIAVEIKFERVRKIWSKIKNHSLNNLMIICGEAECATTYYIPNESVTEIYINFPDPWPKKRHWKHRLIKDSFIKEMHRTLIPEGTFTFVTDDEEYSKVTIEEVKHNGLFQNEKISHELAHYGSSYFEDLWRSKGKQIRYHQWQKLKSSL